MVTPFGGKGALMFAVVICVWKSVQLAWFVAARWSRWWLAARHSLGALRSRRCGHLSSSEMVGARAVGDVEAYIADRIDAKVDANVAGAAQFLSHAFALSAVIGAVNAMQRGMLIFSAMQVFLVVMLMLGLAAVSLCPGRTLAGRAGAAYSTLMGFACALMFFAVPVSENVFVTEGMLLVTRICLSVRYHRTHVVLFWNLVFIIVGGHRMYSALGLPFLCIVVSYQTWNFVAVVLLSYWAAEDTGADVRRQVEALALQDESCGLWTLLDLVCDVVVPLDAALRITEKAPRFGAMVTLQGRSVEGMRLQDFMPRADDRQAFERCAQAEAEGEDIALPRALQVKFRDGLGNILDVELFFVQFWTLGHRRSFVGVRELGDASPPQECRRFPGARQRRRRRCASPLASSDDAASSCSSASSEGLADAGAGRALAPTSDMGVELALVHLMRLCSVGAPPREQPLYGADTDGRCCPFHLRVCCLQSRLCSLAGMHCAPEFAPKAAGQCRACGFLAAGPGGRGARAVCFACEAEVELRPPAAPVRRSL